MARAYACWPRSRLGAIPAKNGRLLAGKRGETVRNRHEITVSRHVLVSKRHEITISRRVLVSKRHELTVSRRVLVNKRHELTVSRYVLVSKRHELTVSRRVLINKRRDITDTRHEITVSSLKSSPFLIKMDGNRTVETGASSAMCRFGRGQHNRQGNRAVLSPA